MADTLAEIYRNTLAESDFDSNGEATIFTTNSSTSHVIKSVQAEEVNSSLLLSGTLEVNGFDLVALSANSSGTEIIAPSSTVKVKTNSIPFTYLDDRFYVQDTATNVTASIDTIINGSTAATGSVDTTTTLPTSITGDSILRVVAPELGPNNNTFFMRHDANSSHIAVLYDSSANTLWSHSTSYVPKWFDGYRYVYYIGTSNGNIERLDTWSSSGAVTTINNDNFPNSASTYARMFGIRDKWLFFWPSAANSKGFALDLTTNVVQDLTTNNADNAFSSMDEQFFAVETVSNGIYIFQNTGNQVRYWDWDGTEILQSSNGSQYTTLQLTGSNQTYRNSGASKKITVGTKFYYINSNNKLAYIEFEGTPAFGAEVSATAYAATAPYGHDVTYVQTVPTQSEVNARGISTSIGVKLRITGVTSA
jgi:hypothetical protein